MKTSPRAAAGRSQRCLDQHTAHSDHPGHVRQDGVQQDALGLDPDQYRSRLHPQRVPVCDRHDSLSRAYQSGRHLYLCPRRGLLNSPLTSIANAQLTPHIAGLTLNSRKSPRIHHRCEMTVRHLTRRGSVCGT